MNEQALEFDIAVVGAGPAGLAAACAATECGKRVVVIDETPWLGGQIWRGQQQHSTVSAARDWIERFNRCGARLLDRTSVIAVPRPGTLLIEREQADAGEVRWKKLILATGARELFLPFPGWTLPGVMGAGGLQAMVKTGWPIRGKRVVIAGSGPLLLAVADGLKQHGADVRTIAEQSPMWDVMGFGLSLARFPEKLWQAVQLRMRLLGIPYRCGIWPVRADGQTQIEAVTLTDGERTWTESCDYLACGFGLVPNVELALATGCRLDEQGFVSVDRWQRTSKGDVYCAGEPTGIGGVDCALVEGSIAGYAAAGDKEKAEMFLDRCAKWHRFRRGLAEAFALRSELQSIADDATLLCRCEDVTIGQVRRYRGWRDAKLQTRCGMGACQGRVCGAAAGVLFGWRNESIRPPVFPARVGTLGEARR